MEHSRTFGEWLRARRGGIGLGLRAFAQQTGLDPGNLSKYERGVLSPPQDEETLERIAVALKLERRSAEYGEFIDLAAASAGRLPPDLATDPKLLARMPLLFRTARGKMSRDEIIKLAERLKGL